MTDKKEVKYRSRYEITRALIDDARRWEGDRSETALEEIALSLAVIADILKQRMR